MAFGNLLRIWNISCCQHTLICSCLHPHLLHVHCPSIQKFCGKNQLYHSVVLRAGVQGDDPISPITYRCWEDICQSTNIDCLGIRDLYTSMKASFWLLGTLLLLKTNSLVTSLKPNSSQQLLLDRALSYEDQNQFSSPPFCRLNQSSMNIAFSKSTKASFACWVLAIGKNSEPDSLLNLYWTFHVRNISLRHTGSTNAA
jgi:hypothetical protein